MKNLRLIGFREEKRLTQGDLAEKIGYTKGLVCLIELGKRKGNIGFWLRLQKAFNLSNDDLVYLMEGATDDREKTSKDYVLEKASQL